jgi:hypothetical protein
MLTRREWHHQRDAVVLANASRAREAVTDPVRPTWETVGSAQGRSRP